jgi:hypothetical protein
MPGDVVRNYRIKYGVEDRAKAPIKSLETGLINLSTQVGKTVKDVEGFSLVINSLGQAAEWATGHILALNAAVKAFPARAATDAQKLRDSLLAVDINANNAATSVGRFKAELAQSGNAVGGIKGVQAAVQSAQRSTYGLLKNAQEANQALGQIGAQASGINNLATATTGLGSNLKVTAASGEQARGSMGGLMVAMMALSAADTVVRAVGDSIKSAREDTEGWAREALKLRDELRELANLQGKPGADNQVVGKHLEMRLETGMSSQEARKFDEQFRGSLPLAKDAGGINDQTAEKLAPEVGKLAVRTGLEGGTAGDLAGSLGTFGKVPDAEVGLGQAQQVVDLLNDGRGNLTPLVKELMKDAAATVGPGKAFGTLQERAAAVSTSTALGAIGRSSTRINQAIAGLSGFDKEQGETLKQYGIKDTDDFRTRIEKIKPLVDEAKAKGVDPLGYLASKGFTNQVEQKAIVGFVDNLDSLQRKDDSVSEDPGAPDAKARAAGQRSDRLNDQFYATDKAARNRVAGVKVESAQLARGVKQENYLIEKQEAEARLLASNKIDTAKTNEEDKYASLFGLTEKFGMKSGRDMRIDMEIKNEAYKQREAELGRTLTKEEGGEIYNAPASFAADYLASLKAKQNQPAGKPQANPGFGGVGAVAPQPAPPQVAVPALPAQAIAPPPDPAAAPPIGGNVGGPKKVTPPGLKAIPRGMKPGPNLKTVDFRFGENDGPVTRDLLFRNGENQGPATSDLLYRPDRGGSGLVQASMELPGSRSGSPEPFQGLSEPAGSGGGGGGLALTDNQAVDVLRDILSELKRRDGRPPTLPGPRAVYADRA